MRAPAVFRREETDSTQNDARRLIERSEAVHGDVCTALYQNAGRGRIAGRTWEGEKGAALMFTLILEKKKIPTAPPLSLILGLGEALAIEKTLGLEPRIKWPNDVYLKGKKCGGILCESEGAYWLCGMGINLNQTQFYGELAEKATSLRLIRGLEVDGESLLHSLTGEIFQVLTQTPETILASIENRLLWKGLRKTLLMGDPSQREELAGTVEGINKDGALLFRTGDEVRKIYSAEFLS